MTRERWEALLEFADATGLKILFGLNGCYGRPSKDEPMNRSNAEALFAATATSQYASSLWGFELSNEVVPGTISPAAWSADAAALKASATTIFSTSGLSPPPMVGPDQSCCSAQQGVIETIQPGVLTALTYHEYPECVDNSANGMVFSPTCLDRVRNDAVEVVAIANSANGTSKPAAWMGEGADHSGGGVVGLTDTFRSSFYVAWLYGATAVSGVELTARQCLSGGDYELIQRVGFQPNPDFWTVWLFKTLMGGGASVFNVTSSVPVTSGVVVFAFSAATITGATHVLLAVNLQVNTTVSVALLGDALNFARTEFHLSGDVTVEHGDVQCNGNVLKMDATTHMPPSWQTLGVPANAGSTLTLAPASITFVLLA